MNKFVIMNCDNVTSKIKGNNRPRMINDEQCLVRVEEFNEELLQEYIKYTNKQIQELDLELITKHPEKNEIYYQREPFASKYLKDGKSLFRRKHGYKMTIAAGEEKALIVSTPYVNCKINKLEVIDANPLDRIDMMVLDTPLGHVTGHPNALLNQFGFDVVVSELLYSDKSDYDADLFLGLQVQIVYKNDSDIDKEVGFNIIFHEVV